MIVHECEVVDLFKFVYIFGKERFLKIILFSFSISNFVFFAFAIFFHRRFLFYSKKRLVMEFLFRRKSAKTKPDSELEETF